MALAYTVRERMLDGYIRSLETMAAPNAGKVVAYLSAEFLTGPHLGNALHALDIWDTTRDALSRVGQSLSALLDQEEEPGLGNGGSAAPASYCALALIPAAPDARTLSLGSAQMRARPPFTRARAGGFDAASSCSAHRRG